MSEEEEVPQGNEETKTSKAHLFWLLITAIIFRIGYGSGGD